MPAPGPSLLNEREFKNLNGFLETINEENNLFYDPKFAPLDFPWDDEPQFPQPPTVSQHLQPFIGNPLPTTPPGMNSLGSRMSNMTSTLSTDTIQSNLAGTAQNSLHTSLDSIQANMGLSSPPLQAASQPIIVNPFNEAHGLLPPASSLQTPSEAAALNTLAWGSDPHFAGSGYHAPPTSTTTEQDIQRKVLAIVTVNKKADAANLSPVNIKFERIGEDLGGSDAGSSTFTAGNTQSPTLSATQSSGVKRRADDDGDQQQQHARKSRQRKESSAEPVPKKRGGKRDQLTEAEKRANHIHSEQKRRNQIKNGFDTLTEMVPELKGGGFSKSAVLQHAAVYVASLKGGNQKLREMLMELEERNGQRGPVPGGRHSL